MVPTKDKRTGLCSGGGMLAKMIVVTINKRSLENVDSIRSYLRLVLVSDDSNVYSVQFNGRTFLRVINAARHEVRGIKSQACTFSRGREEV